MGANFRELIGTVKYRKKNWQISGRFNYALIGKDSTNTSTNMGQNIFLSYTTRPYEYGHYTAQGVQNNYYHLDLKCSYFFILDMNLRVEAGIM
jgi:hypothetical protein